MSEILITGGAGFIGSHLTELLLTRNHSVTIVDDLSTGTPANLKHLEHHSGLTFVHGDIGNEELLNEVIQNKDQVYHPVSYTHLTLPTKA